MSSAEKYPDPDFWLPIFLREHIKSKRTVDEQRCNTR